ncbi:MAG TPA: hypothetical protein PK612_03270, partial [Bacilli bacterium]|nr:hypothetical protein [Bacilli bacterium]
MERELQTIQLRKKSLTNRLMSVKNKAILTIYDSIVNERKDLHARLKKTTANDRFLFTPTVMAAKQTINEVKRLKLAQPQQDRERGEWLAILAFQAINKRQLSKKISKKVYEYTREYEGEQKEDLLLKTAEINRSEQADDPKIFYICSRHNDCAVDHKDYQGKVYIDANWREVVKDDKEILKIEQYIRNFGVDTYQWVIFEPVWLVVRPNCRHYFKDLRVSEVLGNKVENILKQNRMIHAKGRRSMRQTIRHDMTRKTYTINEVEALLSKYRERLSLHEQMAAIKHTHILQKAID